MSSWSQSEETQKRVKEARRFKFVALNSDNDYADVINEINGLVGMFETLSETSDAEVSYKDNIISSVVVIVNVFDTHRKHRVEEILSILENIFLDYTISSLALCSIEFREFIQIIVKPKSAE